jgi:hypothetical protein
LDEDKFDLRLNDFFSAFKTTPNDVYIHKQDIYLKHDFDTTQVKGKLYLDEALRQHFTGREDFPLFCTGFCYKRSKIVRKSVSG